MTLPLANLRFRFHILAVAIGLCLLYFTFRGESAASLSNTISSYAKGRVAADVNEDVAICVATRDQSRDLPEFLVHHYHHHGIRRFYIMDDRSNPPLSTFKNYGIPRSAISFQYWNEKSQQDEMQNHIYAECVRMYGPLHKWMAFIDADEFLETKAPETLRSILKEFENTPNVGALGVNWRIHQSSGLETRPESVRKSFITCAGDATEPAEDGAWRDSRLVKSFVRMDLFDSPWSPHHFKTTNDTYTVGEHGDRIIDRTSQRMPITRDRIALHHYTTKSREQFAEKIGTWQAKGNHAAKGWDYWDHIEGLPSQECLEMTKFDP